MGELFCLLTKVSSMCVGGLTYQDEIQGSQLWALQGAKPQWGPGQSPGDLPYVF